MVKAPVIIKLAFVIVLVKSIQDLTALIGAVHSIQPQMDRSVMAMETVIRDLMSEDHGLDFAIVMTDGQVSSVTSSTHQLHLPPLTLHPHTLSPSLRLLWKVTLSPQGENTEY